RRRGIEQRTIFGLALVLVLTLGVAAGLGLAARAPAEGEAPPASTATLRSHVIAALTAITTVTATPAPSATPIATPEPLVGPKTGMRMLYLAPGPFRMGNDEGQPEEAPAHMLRMNAYFIDETEVTNGHYAACVEDGACRPPATSRATFHEAYYGDPDFANYPVLFVSWFAARDFCNWREARLPTEAEWERAASFDFSEGIKTIYPWGDEFDGLRLNFCDAGCWTENRNSEFDDGQVDTAPVMHYPAGQSAAGLYDMAGNVMEWVNDWYDSAYYARSSEIHPLGPLEGEVKAIRGGSWLSNADEVRTTSRTSFEPAVSRANLGFRCAVSAP
ncbi:MAG: formylglycine-generating enzyme family protein, partial [Candidatus Promineifilaceae bacterium]